LTTKLLKTLQKAVKKMEKIRRIFSEEIKKEIVLEIEQGKMAYQKCRGATK
jgi:hypothetical protein